MLNLKEKFGRNLKILRKSKNLTQEQRAELLDINQRQLTRVENGLCFVSATVLEKLVVALNIDIKQLFDFELNKNVELNEEKEKLNLKEVEKILAKLKKISNNPKHLNYINLAFDSLQNSEARKKLVTLIEGMELL